MNLDGSSLVIPLDNNPKIAEMLYQVSTENWNITLSTKVKNDDGGYEVELLLTE